MNRKPQQLTHEEATHFLFEYGQLGYIPRSGWRTECVELTDRQTVLQHTARTVALLFVLMRMENTPDPAMVALLGLLHDFGEVRSLDHDFVAKQYLTAPQEQITEDQMQYLGPVGGAFQELVNRYIGRPDTEDTNLMNDADNLDVLIECMRLKARRYEIEDRWTQHHVAQLRTESGREVWRWIQDANGMQKTALDWMLGFHADIARESMASILLANVGGESNTIEYIEPLYARYLDGRYRLPCKSKSAEYQHLPPTAHDATIVEEALQLRERPHRFKLTKEEVMERLKTEAGRELCSVILDAATNKRTWSHRIIGVSD